MSKKDSVKERAARAARRSLAKEAPAAKEPSRKRARLDSSSDLINLLPASAPVLDIFAASGSRPLSMEVVLDVVMRGELKLPHKMYKMYEFRFSM